MKNYKIMSLLMALVCVLSLGFTSCSDDDDNDRPVINLTEIGHDNNLKAHPGHDLHLEAKVVCANPIKRIDIEIHLENGTNFEIKKSFTEGKYIGVRNIEFHEHIDIPANAPLGEYHLHFTVTDQTGQQTTVKSHLNIVEDDGHDDGHDHHD